MKKVLSYIVAMSFFAGFVSVLIFSCSTAYKTIQATLPDLSAKPDGVYRGEYSMAKSPNKAVLDVTLQNQVITAINIVEHSCSPIGKKAEKITENIIKQQKLNVDAISGATSSSKTILKAVENALQ
jgi:uncharacterized protein with FMN-binding domain